MGELIPIGIHKPQEGGTTIINENGVDYGDRITAIENAQGIKTGASGKVFVIWNEIGYEYTETYPLYYINGQAFPAGEKKIPLDSSHATLDRIDTFGLNANGAFVITGTPALEPIAPTIDSSNEIFVTTVLVKANTVEPAPDPNPTPVANVVVYKENIEFTGTSVSGGISNFNFTGKPFSGSKSIKLLGKIKLKDTVSIHDASQFEALRLKILKNYQGSGFAKFSFQFLLNDTLVSSTETIEPGVDFPYASNPAVYETVLIDLNRFTFYSDDFNEIEIIPIKASKFTGSTLIDDVSLIAKSIHVVTSTGNSTIDTSEFVSKHSFHFSPFDLSGVVVDLDVSTRSGSAYAIQGTVTELHSLHNSNLIPKFFYGQDFYIKNDQATPFVIKNKSGVIAQERFIFSFPNDEDISIQPKEVFHFKNMMTEYNGGTLEFVGVVSYSKEEMDTLLTSKADRILSLKPITGTTYNVIADDSLVELVYDGTDPINVIVPNNTTVPLPIGTIFYSVATNTGVLTVSGEAGVTFQTAVGFSAGQNEVRKYTKRGTNVWGIEGSIVSSADMVLANTQTVSGLKTFLSGKFGLRNVANTFTSFFTNTNTASRTYTLQDRNGTLADLTDVNAKMDKPTGGVANRIPLYLTSVTMGLSRLWDTGSKLGIGTTKTPTEDITFGNQTDRTIGIEQSSNTNNGKDLTVSAGRTINFVEGTGFQPLNVSSATYYGSVVLPINQDVYVATSNNILKRTGGLGDFVAESNSSTNAQYHRGMGFDTSNNVYVAVATGGYKRKNYGSTTWTQVNPTGTSGASLCISGDYLGNLYLGTTSGLYKQTGLTGSFVSVYTGNIVSLSISPVDGSIYIISSDGNGANNAIYKQTEGSGSFNLIQNAAYSNALCATVSGNVYCKLNPNILGKQTAGIGTFTDTGILLSNFTDLASDNNSSLYAPVSSNGIYFLDNNEVGSLDLNGGVLKLKAGTGKGAGQSRTEFYTGQKTTSGTDMQASTLRGYFDENGYFVCLNIPTYADDAAADADTTLVSGAYYKITGSRQLYQKP